MVDMPRVERTIDSNQDKSRMRNAEHGLAWLAVLICGPVANWRNFALLWPRWYNYRVPYLITVDCCICCSPTRRRVRQSCRVVAMATYLSGLWSVARSRGPAAPPAFPFGGHRSTCRPSDGRTGTTTWESYPSSLAMLRWRTRPWTLLGKECAHPREQWRIHTRTVLFTDNQSDLWLTRTVTELGTTPITTTTNINVTSVPLTALTKNLFGLTLLQHLLPPWSMHFNSHCSYNHDNCTSNTITIPVLIRSVSHM